MKLVKKERIATIAVVTLVMSVLGSILALIIWSLFLDGLQ